MESVEWAVWAIVVVLILIGFDLARELRAIAETLANIKQTLGDIQENMAKDDGEGEEQLIQMQITRTDEDDYHVEVNDEAARIDEHVNGSQLLGILASREPIDTSTDEVLSSPIGIKKTIYYIPALR